MKLTLLAAVLLSTACSTNVGSHLQNNEEEAESTKLTLEIWQSFSEEQQEEIISEIDFGFYADGPYHNYKIINLENLDSSEQVYYPPYREYAKKVLSAARGYISKEEIEQNTGSHTGFATVGKPRQDLYILTLADSHAILGSKINLRQNGAHKEDATSDDNFYFANAEEAKAEGFDPTADVNWSARASFDHTGKIYDGDNYYEWSGW